MGLLALLLVQALDWENPEILQKKVPKPSERPKDFYRDGFDVRSWDEIAVPSNWELQSYGVPIYVDAGLPFAEKPESPLS